MPDKYEFRRYADNITHPWFKDIQTDFKSLLLSPNRLLLCILCIILMNIDDSTLFEHFGPDPYQYDNYDEHEERIHPGNNKTLVHSDHINLFNAYELIIDEGNTTKNKQCNKIPINNYLGSSKKNVFHTQLMIGVLFAIMMNCRLPILFTFINIIIRSGCSFKPKIIPMFIDRKALKPSTFYGSSYKLLSSKDKISYDYLQRDMNYYDDSSSDEEDEDEIESNDIDHHKDLNYDLMKDELPKQLFSEQYCN